MNKHRNYSKKEKLILAIDEVGRGALAGPLILGGVFCFNNRTNRKILKGIKDSKKMTFNQRLKWFEKLKNSNLCFYVVFLPPHLIDQKGMAWCLKEGVKRICKKTSKKPDLILLDGGLVAPTFFKQKSIVKGDDKNCFIAAAAVYAKVTRDLYMINLEKKFGYSFNKHKGYGTKKHFELIKKYGPSKIHRLSFLKKLGYCQKAKIK